MSAESPPLQLPGLQHLQLKGGFGVGVTMPVSFLASCTHLQVVKLHRFDLKGPGNLVASTKLQHLELDYCTLAAADGAAGLALWQQVFPGPGQLPHLTSLRLFKIMPELQQADIEGVAACCSNLKALDLPTLGHSAPALAGRLPGLTLLHLKWVTKEDYGPLAQLTGLRQLVISDSNNLSVVELRQLAALNELTSLGFDIFYKSELKTLADHLMKDNLPGYCYGIINKAPSGSPSDVSHRLLDMCDVMDACGELSIGAVITAAACLTHHDSSVGEGFKALTTEALLAAAAALKGD